jgi:tryptophan synthase alpha subunit
VYADRRQIAPVEAEAADTMTIDTLAYVKPLEAAGIERKAAEAQAAALNSHVLPDLITKADLASAKLELEQAIERIEHRLTLRVIGIVAAFDAALSALLRFVH